MSEQSEVITSLLGTFESNNPQCNIHIKDDTIIVDDLWGVSAWSLSFPIQTKSIAKTINSLQINPKFDAFIFGKTVEVFYGLFDPQNEDSAVYLNKRFDFFLNGDKFTCEFKEPSKKFWEVVNSLQKQPAGFNDYAPHLDVYLNDLRLDKLPEKIRKIHEERVLVNFNIKLPNLKYVTKLEEVFENLNFAMKYYDRRHPQIIIREDLDSDQSSKYLGQRFLEDEFPKNITIQSVDDNISKLIAVASTSNARHAFVYYYQVFEYAGFYYVESKLKNKLKRMLKDPSLINCDDEKINGLLSFLTELNHNDDVKMKKVLEEIVDPKLIWPEIDHMREALSKSYEFEGGFVVKPFISENITMDEWCSSWMPKTFDYFTKIRNCLVHARERRENKVILPTKNNTQKLLVFLPIIRRVAEQVAINSEM